MIDVRGHDARQEGQEYQVLPEGEYLAHIDSARDVQARGGKQSWQLELKGTLSYQGARVPFRLYVPHTQADGQTGIAYGRKRVFDLFVACGIPTGDMLDEGLLAGKNVILHLKRQEADGRFGPKNDLAGSRKALRPDGGYENPQMEMAAQLAASTPADTAGLPADMQGNPLTQPAADNMQPTGATPF